MEVLSSTSSLNSSVALLITSVLLFSVSRMSTCQTLPLIIDAVYNEVNAMDLELKIHETLRNVLTATECARTCTIRRSWRPGCQAFRFDRTENTCDLYVYGSKITDPDLRLFLLPMKNRLHTIAVGEEVFSITYVNPQESYGTAIDICHSLGGKLLELDSLGKYAAVRAIQPELRSAKAWIGASDREVEGEWVTEEEGHPIDHSTWLWADGQPKAKYNCACLSIKYLNILTDACAQRKQFFCEVSVE